MDYIYKKYESNPSNTRVDKSDVHVNPYFWQTYGPNWLY